MQAAHIAGGFSSPVLEAQTVFRAVMEAMARPGTIRKLDAAANPPAPLSPTAAAIALALCDHDTPVWLDPALRTSDAVVPWLSFHAGAPLVRTPVEAHFALVAEPATLVALENFAQGTQDYPDRSTTLILQVESLQAGVPLVLEGPGIETVASLAPTPMPRHFAEQWQQNNARYPHGIDLILAGQSAVACLPRTTRIRKGER